MARKIKVPVRERARLRALRRRVLEAESCCMCRECVRNRRAHPVRPGDPGYDLFKRVLSPEQLRGWRSGHAIPVIGSEGGPYVVLDGAGATYNVVGETKRFCAYIPGGVPPADQLAAQVLLLEADERGFLRTACSTYSPF